MSIITESKATRRLTMLLVMIMGVAMIIPSNLAFASPDDGASDEGTTEDDGWTEGDYEGNSEEQEEQAQEDWKDAGRPGDNVNDGNGDGDSTDGESEEQNQEQEEQTDVDTPEEELPPIDEEPVDPCLEDPNAVGCGTEPVSSFVTCSDGSSAATQAECQSISTAAQEQLQTCQDGSVVSVNEACPKPETITCPDGSTVSVDEDCPPTDKPLPDCDGSFQDCITPYGDVCPAGSAAHECELPEPVSREPPNNGCLFNTELPKCAPIDGKCPDSFGMNEDGRCFPEHSECPPGYHTTEDDETGECNPNSECVGDNYLLVDDDKSCREKRTYCLETPTPDECKDDDNGETKVIHKTTVIHGASASASASATTNTNAADVSNCKLDGSADGIQQKFDSIKYRACGLYPNGQIAYGDGFVVGCTQVGNTQQLCQAFVVMNTQSHTVTQPQTQPNMLSTTHPTQATQTQSTIHPTQAIQPSGVS